MKLGRAPTTKTILIIYMNPLLIKGVADHQFRGLRDIPQMGP
jgi:hypothetical protein